MKMSRKRTASPCHIEDFDDDFGEDSCSSGKYLTLRRNFINENSCFDWKIC